MALTLASRHFPSWVIICLEVPKIKSVNAAIIVGLDFMVKIVAISAGDGAVDVLTIVTACPNHIGKVFKLTAF